MSVVEYVSFLAKCKTSHDDDRHQLDMDVVITHVKRLRIGGGARRDRTVTTIEAYMSILKSQDYRCAYTGLPMKFSTNGTALADPWYCSIDQIHPGKGYEANNVAFCIRGFNRLKSSFTVKESVRSFNMIINSVNICLMCPRSETATEAQDEVQRGLLLHVWQWVMRKDVLAAVRGGDGLAGDEGD